MDTLYGKHSSIHVITAGISGCLLLIATLVEIGWAENITILKSIFPGIVSMNPHTALCFFLTGVALLVLIFVHQKWGKYVVVACGLVLVTFGVVRFLGIFNIVDLHLDQVLFHAQLIQVTTFSNGRIAPNTAFNLILVGIMVVMLAFKRFRAEIQVLGALVFLVALLAIVGYIYEVHNLYGFLAYTPMALNTAICFCLASLGIQSYLAEGFLVDMVISKTPGGVIGRRLVPTIIFAPLILGYAIVHGIQTNIYDSNYGMALFTVAIIGTFLLMLFLIVYRINQIDRERLSAEKEARESGERAEFAKEALNIKLKETEDQNRFLQDSKRAMLNLVEDLNTTKKDLEREKNKDEALLESIGDAVFAIDENGIIILFNPVAEQLSGIPMKKAIGKSYREVLRFVREDTGTESFAFIEQALKGVKGSMENHTMLINALGAKVPVADSASPLVDNEGTVTGAVVVFRDVTREREIDKAKTEFVSLASHQLRTPLSAIGWYAELLSDGDAGKVTKKQAEFLAQITESNTRMVELVNSLLNVSRIDMGTLASDPVHIDIVSVCESVLSELAQQIATHQISIKKAYAEPAIDMLVDPQLIRIVIQNLLSNAVKYTPDGGSVTLSVAKDAALFHLSVADTGYGIPITQQDKIFQKLFRADNAKEKVTDGNGLGLYVVKSVVENHGGKIWFTSKENEGTSFFVELPASGMRKVEGAKTLS